MEDIIVIGGGLAGLVSAINLKKAGYKVTLIEKRDYPSHRVCGEYISMEVKPYLVKNGMYPHDLEPAKINKLWLTSVSGKLAKVDLRMGGFGVSRHALDLHLYQLAQSLGVTFLLKETVSSTQFNGEYFEVNTINNRNLHARFVLGAFGKRSVLDKKMARPFIQRKSPYIGVKYHIQCDFPDNVIALHNFQDGYCGMSRVEGNKYNLCYLSHQNNLKSHGSIEKMEKEVLWKNPYLKGVFHDSRFLFNKPEVINEISFEKKRPVEQHVLMVGDAAGLITPLCGNGMAMAIHAAKIASETLISYSLKDRSSIEKSYEKRWEKEFRRRLWVGKNIQHLFGSSKLSNLAVMLAKYSKPVTSRLIEQTHGRVI